MFTYLNLNMTVFFFIIERDAYIIHTKENILEYIITRYQNK